VVVHHCATRSSSINVGGTAGCAGVPEGAPHDEDAPKNRQGGTDQPNRPSTSEVQPLGQCLLAALTLAAAALLLAPIWTVRYPLLIDYPNHLASAFALAHLNDPAFHLNQFYAANWNTYPYLTMDVLLLGLQRIVSIDIAGRLLLSLAVLSVPAGAWFFIRRANPGQESLSVWALLVSSNLFFFLYGFLNLQFSLAIGLFLLGVWLRHLERPRAISWCALPPLTTMLYFTHLMSFGVVAVVMTVYAIVARLRWRQALFAWGLFLPGALLYLHATMSLHASHALQFRSLAAKAAGLLVVVLSYSPAIDFLTLLVAIGAVVWARRAKPRVAWGRHWLWVTGCLFALYWIFPASYGAGMDADRRLLPFVVLLGLGSLRMAPKRGRALAAIAALLFGLRGSALEIDSVRAQPHLASMAESFRAIPKGARVLPLVDWAEGRPMVERHFWAYGVIQGGWFSPCLFHDPGVQPFAIKAKVYNPYGPAFAEVKSVDWTAVRNDYDYVWSFRSPQFSGPLGTIGARVFSSGDLEVFRVASSEPTLAGVAAGGLGKEDR
jgi:hypothetical protein